MIVIPSFRGLVSRVFATSASGSLYAWGYNGGNNITGSGQLGIGNKVDRSSPVLINSSTGFSGSVSGWTKISSGWRHSLGINSGKLYSWGSNYRGQLGLGLTPSNDTNKSSPTQIGSDSTWISVSSGVYHSLALKSDNTLWAWGGNNYGQLGNGDTNDKSAPITISGSNWSSISAGWNHSLAIRTDGSLWAWGANGSGQLGDSSTDQRNSPVKIGTTTSWAMVSAGRYHSLGIRTDGTLWAWGSNSQYQLGIGKTPTDPPYKAYYSSPKQVGYDSNWLKISAGGYHSIGIKGSGASGTLWSWGLNGDGQLGRNDNTNESKPIQIGSSNWNSASAGYKHSGGINSSEKLFFWGSNNKGQIGDITTVSKNSPVAIMSSANFIYSASMKDGSSFAIKKQ